MKADDVKRRIVEKLEARRKAREEKTTFTIPHYDDVFFEGTEVAWFIIAA